MKRRKPGGGGGNGVARRREMASVKTSALKGESASVGVKKAAKAAGSIMAKLIEKQSSGGIRKRAESSENGGGVYGNDGESGLAISNGEEAQQRGKAREESVGNKAKKIKCYQASNIA